tara:strand:- start:1215 stop:1466 length:252 start_codon:yes stop_codon:yes gene_type:complete
MTTRAKKLSRAQQHVLDRMKDGWELGRSSTFEGGAWLQKDGLGRGGQTETVNSATLIVLWRNGLIVPVGSHFPTQKYTLKETP